MFFLSVSVLSGTMLTFKEIFVIASAVSQTPLTGVICSSCDPVTKSANVWDPADFLDNINPVWDRADSCPFLKTFCLNEKLQVNLLSSISGFLYELIPPKKIWDPKISPQCVFRGPKLDKSKKVECKHMFSQLNCNLTNPIQSNPWNFNMEKKDLHKF